jgi:hypothetical protein
VSPHLRTETDPVAEALRSLEHLPLEKVKKNIW